MKFKHPDGRPSDMFAVVANVNGTQKYCCLLCSKNEMGVVKFINHARSKNHMHQVRTVNEKCSSQLVLSKGMKMKFNFKRIDRFNIIFCR